MSKRIKSALITLTSLVASVIITPQWADFVTYVHDKLVLKGWHVAVIGLLMVVIDNAWKAILNARMIAKARELGQGTATLDLY